MVTDQGGSRTDGSVLTGPVTPAPERRPNYALVLVEQDFDVTEAAWGVANRRRSFAPHGTEPGSAGSWGALADCLNEALVALARERTAALEASERGQALGMGHFASPDAGDDDRDGGLGSGRWLGAEMP